MTPGRVTKSAAIAALQGHHDITYDRARETMKQVRSDATGSLELEEWLEVSTYTPSRLIACADNGPLCSLRRGRARKVLLQWSQANNGGLSRSVERILMPHILSTKTKGQSTRISSIACWPETLICMDDCQYLPTRCKFLRNVAMVSCASSPSGGRHP